MQILFQNEQQTDLTAKDWKEPGMERCVLVASDAGIRSGHSADDGLSFKYDKQFLNAFSRSPQMRSNLRLTYTI
jgi:hypothetical protein